MPYLPQHSVFIPQHGRSLQWNRWNSRLFCMFACFMKLRNIDRTVLWFYDCSMLYMADDKLYDLWFMNKNRPRASSTVIRSRLLLFIISYSSWAFSNLSLMEHFGCMLSVSVHIRKEVGWALSNNGTKPLRQCIELLWTSSRIVMWETGRVTWLEIVRGWQGTTFEGLLRSILFFTRCS